MDPIDFFNSMSVSTVYCICIVTLLIVSFFSYKMGVKSKSLSQTEPSDFITNNILGLLALILGFSFSLVVERFERRRILGVEELNVISTVYQRAKVINFKDPKKNHELFKRYVDLRIDSHLAPTPTEAVTEMVQLKAKIWKSFQEVAVKERGELESGYMDSLNEMFTTANSRYLAMLKMLPGSFYFIILAMAATAIGLMNFDRGYNHDTRHWRTTIFIFLFGLVFSFIFDLDHSKSGFIQIKDPLLILRTLLASQ